MKEMIYNEALRFAEDCGYHNESEKDKLVFDFVSGANFVMKKMFDYYLDGGIQFNVDHVG